MSFRDSQRLEVAFDTLREEAENLSLSDKNTAQLAQLMTVWASAYLEAACREIMMSYTRKRAETGVASFVTYHLNQFRNPKTEKILTLIRSFDEAKARQLEEFAGVQIKNSIDSIVDNRHRIAHGRMTGISIVQIVRYFADAREFTKKIESLFAT